MSDIPSREAFASQLNAVFKVTDATDDDDVITVDMTLAECDDLSNDHCDAFSLIFNGPAEPALGQNTYGVANETLGDFSLFMVPIGADDTGRQYQAVFNNLKGEVTPPTPGDA